MFEWGLRLQVYHSAAHSSSTGTLGSNLWKQRIPPNLPPLTAQLKVEIEESNRQLKEAAWEVQGRFARTVRSFVKELISDKE